jgi:nucleotide-binding universal stress UspA family protein
LPQAIAAANQFGATLAFLSIIPAAPSSIEEALTNWQEDARMRTLERLTELADDAGLDTRPQLYAEFKSARPVSEQILETAGKLRADLIIMGLHDSAHTGVISHLDLATTYDVVCQAGSPVLTVNCSSGSDLRARATEVTASPLPETDVIRTHGFGAKW